MLIDTYSGFIHNIYRQWILLSTKNKMSYQATKDTLIYESIYIIAPIHLPYEVIAKTAYRNWHFLKPNGIYLLYNRINVFLSYTHWFT